MLILDDKSGTTFDAILIMLTPAEKDELLSYLKGIKVEEGDHFHLYSETDHQMITMAVYTPSNMHFFSQKIQALLDADKPMKPVL